MSTTDRRRRRPPNGVPYAEIIIPLEGAASGAVRGCRGDWGVRDRVIDWCERDPDLRELLDAFRRVRDREAA